jgi:glycogen operon protein
MSFLCLRHWVLNYHIDGFRFDLASILSRDRNGDLVPNPPLVEMIAEDPLLSDTKIIAEAWDAAGAYQVGSFANMRWAEWNGRYRDDIRRFWRGDSFTHGALATRLSGSSDLYEHSGRHPYHSINFITSHDGFPMADLVSYAYKHNEANGENNCDGDNNNLSANYGVEGPTRRPRVVQMRNRQVRNMFATLLLSQGVPMILSGDEVERTQQGNNNAYCQDNDISWFDWTHVEKHADLLRFVQALIAFRRAQPTLRHTTFMTGFSQSPGQLPDVGWFSPDGNAVDWNRDSHSLVCLLGAPRRPGPTGLAARHVLILIHAGEAPRTFILPPPARPIQWRLFIDTGAETPLDIWPAVDGPPPPESGQINLADRSLVCYVSAQ